MFVAYAYSRYKAFIDDYNQLLVDKDIHDKIALYLQTIKSSISEREFAQFERDVYSEFAPIVL